MFNCKNKCVFWIKVMKREIRGGSGAFALDHNRAVLLVLLLAHPHLLEGTARAQDRAANPRCKALLCRWDYFNAHVLWSDLRNLFLQSLHKSAEARITAANNDVLEQVTSNVDVCLAYGVDYHVLYAGETLELLWWHEHLLKECHSLRTYLNCRAIWKLYLLLTNGLSCTKSLQRLLRNVKVLFLDVLDNL